MKNKNVKFIIMAAVAMIILAIYLSSRTSGPGHYDLSEIPADDMSPNTLLETESPALTEAEQEYRQGKELLDNGDTEGGLLHLERAALLNPSSARIHNDLGVAYARQGLYERAIGEYRTAIAQTPDYVEALYNLGNAFQIIGENEVAMARYYDVLRLDRQYYRAHNNLGGLYALAGVLDSAVVHLETAVEINPDYIDAHRNLASVYEFLGDSTKAAEHTHFVNNHEK